MTKAKRISCFILAVVLSLCVGTTANAAETRASYYLHSYLAYIYPGDNGKISVWFEVESVQTMDEVGVLTISLQEQDPTSSTWSTVQVYRYTNYPGMLKYNVAYNYGHVDYQGKVGYTYRAYVTVWAGDNGNGDSRTILAT